MIPTSKRLSLVFLQTQNQPTKTDDIVISSEEVESAVRLAHKGKACGDDGIYYEHIMFGGVFLYQTLADLFSAMVRYSYVPIEMKKGVIITLYKGGNKRKDDADSYREITLSSVLLQLLERIALTRIQLFDNLTPSCVAGGLSEKHCLSCYIIYAPGINKLRSRKR